MAADGQTGHCRRLAAETKGGKGTKWFPCPLLPLSVDTDTPGPPKAANVHAHFERKATVSAETPPSADGKKRSTVKAQPYRSASTLAISPRVILPSGRSVPSV